MKSWLITIPKTTSWETYQKEIDDVASGELVMNYKTRYFPKEMRVGDRCYVVWNGKVRGWMQIVKLLDFPRRWVCETLGEVWPAGKYIQRSGDWHPVDGPAMTGFRGIREYKEKQ